MSLVCIKINVMKDLFLTIVREINVLEDHISDQLGQLVVAIWTGVFPSPKIGFLVCHDHLTVYQFVIDQSDLTLVNFFCFIQQVKDTVCTSKCHKNKVKLLRHLSNRTIEGAVQLQEGHETTDSQATHTIEGKDPTNQGSQNKGNIS